MKKLGEVYMIGDSQRPIILASGSPRRRELLAGLGIQFEVQVSDIDENVAEELPPHQLVELLSLKKAEAIATKVERGIVIGSDTIVVLNEEILGKPKDEEEAFTMLTRLQGRLHTVYTGVSLIDVENNRREIAHQSTKVKMRSLSNEQICSYIATKEPMDKAGAYAIQGIGATLIEGIEGDYFTVVGLPLALTADILKTFGVHVLS